MLSARLPAAKLRAGGVGGGEGAVGDEFSFPEDRINV